MLSVNEIERLAALIAPEGPGPLRLADPWCGDGIVLARCKAAIERRSGVSVVAYGASNEPALAEEAATLVDQWRPGALYLDVVWRPESLDVLLFHPEERRDEFWALGAGSVLQQLRPALRYGGLLFYAVRQRFLADDKAARTLADGFDIAAVYPLDDDPTRVMVVARRARRRAVRADTVRMLRDIGRNGAYVEGEQQELDLEAPPALPAIWGFPQAPFPVSAPGGAPFYLHRKDPTVEELAEEAARGGVRVSRWWQQNIETIPELRSSSLLPLRDTQIANLLFLGFADNREFNLDGHRYLFRGHTRIVDVDVSDQDDQANAPGEETSRYLEEVQQGGVMLSLTTGEVRELDAEGMLRLVRIHAEDFARAITEKVPPLRADLTLQDWEDQALDQVYRYKRLPGRADYSLTRMQRVIAAVAAQAIEERRTPVVVLNADTGSGKTGMAFGAAMCLRHHYMERKDYEWFAAPEHHGGHRRRRLHMRGSGGSVRAWMRLYRHPKPFTIAFAAEPHMLEKVAKEAKACLPLSLVRVARSVEDVAAFVETTRRMDPNSVGVLIVPKSMSKLGSGWTWAVFEGNGGRCKTQGNAPFHCPDCGANLSYEVDSRTGLPAKGTGERWPVNAQNAQYTIGRTAMRCPECGAPLFQVCRTDWRSGRPQIPDPPAGFFAPGYKPLPGRIGPRPDPVRYPVARYIYRRLRDFFDVVIWDEVHDANAGDTGIAAAYRDLTRAARLGWIEATASNMNGKASDVFARAFHSSAAVRRRFGWDEKAEFVNAYGLHSCEIRTSQVLDETGRFTGKTRQRRIWREESGVQPQLLALTIPYTVSVMIEDLGAPLPPRLEVCDAFSTKPTGGPFDRVLEAYKAIQEFRRAQSRTHPRAQASAFQAALAYLNAPWNAERVVETIRDEEGRVERDRRGKPVRQTLLTIPPTWDLHDRRLLPKEQQLLEEIERALTEGHGISVMIAHVNRGIQERLTWLIDRNFGRGSARYCDVPAAERERWYRRCLLDRVKVIISHPQKLRTGLDLFEYPWIYFYQPIASSITIIQAKGRAWRLGQEWACETHFWYYEATEEHALLQIKANDIIADNILRGGRLHGGLMDMGRSIKAIEQARAALEQGNLRHLGVLFQQAASGGWLSKEEIAAIDRKRAESELKNERERRQRLETGDWTQLSLLSV